MERYTVFTELRDKQGRIHFVRSPVVASSIREAGEKGPDEKGLNPDLTPIAIVVYKGWGVRTDYYQ